MPTDGDIRAAKELNTFVASLDGGVVVPEFAFLPARTGHPNPHFYTMAMWCAIWSNRPMNMHLALEAMGVRWAILHSTAQDDFAFAIRRQFRLSRMLPPSSRIRMITGASVTLDQLWEKSPVILDRTEP